MKQKLKIIYLKFFWDFSLISTICILIDLFRYFNLINSITVLFCILIPIISYSYIEDNFEIIKMRKK